MAAIITEQFRKESARLLYEDALSGGYYIGVGKHDAWDEALSISETAPYPRGSILDVGDVKDSLIDLVAVAASRIDIAIPNVLPLAVLYKEYSGYDPACFYPSEERAPCYVVAGTGAIYLCLKAGGAPMNWSGVTFDGPNSIFEKDGYIWAYAGEIKPASKINNAKFVALNAESDLSVLPSEVGGALYGFRVLNGGSGYSGSVTVEVRGLFANGTTEASTHSVNLSGGSIIGVDRAALYALSGSVATFNYKNYVSAYVVVNSDDTETEDAVIVPLLTPKYGLGFDPTETLPAWYVGFQGEIATVDSQYSQISLAKYDGYTPISGVADMRYSVTFSSTVAAVQNNMTISQSGLLIGKVESVDTATNTVYYTRGTTRGYVGIDTSGDAIDFTAPGETPFSINAVSVTAQTAPTVDIDDVKIIFMDNREAIETPDDQTEDLKIIIQL